MARTSGGRNQFWSPKLPEGADTRGQVVPMFNAPEGVDRFNPSARVGPQHAVKARNFMFDDGLLVSRLGTDLMGSNAASTVMQVVDLVRKGQKKITLRFCLRHLEIFEYGLGAWRSFPVPLTGSERDFFCYTGWADKLLFSNGVDGLWEFDFKLMRAALIPNAPSAKHLTTFGNRVVASSVVWKGEDYPLRVWWTAKNLYKNWLSSQENPSLTPDLAGGYEDLYGSPGGLTDEAMGVFPFSDEQAYLVRSRSVWQMSVSGNVLAPFRFSRMLANVGTPYRNTIELVGNSVVFATREDIYQFSFSGLDRIGISIIDEIVDEANTFQGAFAAYDIGRNEYRLAIGDLVWRYRWQEKGWLTNEYPFTIQTLSRQIQGVAGIPIDNLPATIDELPQFFPPGAINDLVYDRSTDDAMMFVPKSTELTLRETDEPRDVLTSGVETDSELLLETGVINLDATKAVELLELLLEYEAAANQQLIFEYTQNDGGAWLPLSVKDIEVTEGSEVLFVKQERVSRKLRLRVRSLTLGALRLLGIAPSLVLVERSMASKRPKPSSIVIVPSPLSLVVGGTQQLSWQVLDQAGRPITGLSVLFLSTNNSVATVTTTGIVRAIGVGSFAIVASIRNVQTSVQGQVSAASPAAVASITVTPSISQGVTGSQQQFTATLRDANGNILLGRTVSWASSTPGFATISSTGLASLISAGVAAISATSEGVTGGATLTVTAMAAVVDHVDVTPATFSGDTGETVQLVAAPKDASNNTISGKTITWASDNLAVATVSSTGLVTLVGAGSVTITATCDAIDGDSAGTVTEAEVPVATVVMTPGTINIAVGTTQAMTVVTKDALGNTLTGRVISYSSNNTSVATVSSVGIVTAVAVGNAVITATSEGKTDTSPITVTAIPVDNVTIAPSSFTISPGATVQLTATPRDSGGNALTGRVITWGTSDATKATVSSTGLVTAVAAGSVTITATCETKQVTSVGTIGAASFSALNANSGVRYVPEPHPAGVVATLPSEYMETRYGFRRDGTAISFASTVTLTNSGNRIQNQNDLQAAINAAAARSGHSKIRLPSPFPLGSGIQLRRHTGGDFETYIEAIALPSAEFSRANPASMTNSPEFRADSTADAIQCDRGANNYRLVGLKFVAAPKTETIIVYNLVPVYPKEGSTEYKNTISDQPVGIVFDRCLFRGNDDGTGVDNGNVRNGVMLNGSYLAVVDSVVDQICSIGNESKGILSTNAPGPIKVVGNKIEASGINFLLGGNQPEYGAEVGRPRNVEFRRNLLTRRTSWLKDHVDWDGINGRTVKNWWETKNCDGVLVEGNVMENNCADGQSGMGLIVKSGTGNGGSAAGNGSKNVTVRYNKLRNSPRCWNIAALSDELDAVPVHSVALYHNLAYNIGNFAGQVDALAWLLTQGPDDLFIAHNTTILNTTGPDQPHVMQMVNLIPGAKASRFVFKDNITEFAYIFADGGIIGTAAINLFADPGYVWERNVICMPPVNWGSHPGGTNQYDDSRNDIGFVNIGIADFHLSGGSPYKGDGEGGSDPGADIDKVDLATSGVV